MSNRCQTRKRRAPGCSPIFCSWYRPCAGGGMPWWRGVWWMWCPPSVWRSGGGSWRFFILLPFTLGHVKRDWKTAAQSWKWMLVLSFLGISCFNAILYTAAHTTTAINVSLMQTAMPATIILISWVVFQGKDLNHSDGGGHGLHGGSLSHCGSWPMADSDDHGTGGRAMF
jgi:hypothetical protein